MQTNITLTEQELTNIIEQTVTITIKKIKEETKQTNRMLSLNQARTKLGIGYTKLKKWITDGIIKEIDGMIPETEINRILAN